MLLARPRRAFIIKCEKWWEVSLGCKTIISRGCPMIHVLILFYSYMLEHSISLSHRHKNKLLRFMARRIDSAHKTDRRRERRRRGFPYTREMKMKNTCCLLLLRLFWSAAWFIMLSLGLHAHHEECMSAAFHSRNLTCTCIVLFTSNDSINAQIHSVLSSFDSLCFITDFKRTFCVYRP